VTPPAWRARSRPDRRRLGRGGERGDHRERAAPLERARRRGLSPRSWTSRRRPRRERGGRTDRRGLRGAELKLAILAESDVTGRRVAHRVARPRARPTDGFFDDLARGATWCTPARCGALCRGDHRVIGAPPVTTGPRVPRQRSALPPGRPDRGRHAVFGRRVADPLQDGRCDWQRTRRRPGPPPARWPRSWSSCTAAGSRSRACLRTDTPARELEVPSPSPRPPTSSGPSRT